MVFEDTHLVARLDVCGNFLCTKLWENIYIAKCLVSKAECLFMCLFLQSKDAMRCQPHHMDCSSLCAPAVTCIFSHCPVPMDVITFVSSWRSVSFCLEKIRFYVEFHNLKSGH